MSDAARSTGYEDRPLACEFGNHARCPHCRAAGINFFRRGDNFRTVTLCHCDCHDKCPLAGKERVTHRAWSEDCICSGAPIVREIEAEVRDTGEREHAARREAMNAVVGRTTADTDLDQVRADLAAELFSRDVAMSDSAVDWLSRFIVASYRKGNLAALRLGVEALKHGAGLIRGLIRDGRSQQD